MKSKYLWASRLVVAATLATFTTAYAAAEANMQPTQLVSADAQLTQRLNTKNATPGEAVTAKLTSSVTTVNGTKIDKGTELLGKVSKVEASSSHGPASISIVFNQARLENGKVIPIRATLLGAYPPEDNLYGSDNNPMSIQPHLIPADQKIDQEVGVLDHVSMRSNAEADNSGVFRSKDRNFDLRKGTRLQVALGANGNGSGMTAGAE